MIIALERVEMVRYYCDELGGRGPNTCRLEERSSDPNLEDVAVYNSEGWALSEDPASSDKAVV